MMPKLSQLAMYLYAQVKRLCIVICIIIIFPNPHYFRYTQNTPPPKTPPSIAMQEILAIIVSHLDSQRDRVSCCLASRLFFEVASPPLYRTSYSSREGILAGRERHYRRIAGGVSVTYSRSSIFGGTAMPKEDVYPRDTPLPYPPFLFQPSPIRLHLLAFVRCLTYQTDCPQEYDTVNPIDLFPQLETLTIQQVEHHPHWSLPFLSNLRPKHIRLTHIRCLGSDTDSRPYPLDGAVGSQAEKVTIHFDDCIQRSGSSPGGVRITWPAKVKQIDIVFMAPTPGKGAVSAMRSYSQPTPPIIPLSKKKFGRVTRSVAELLISAVETGAVIRIIGLGVKVARRDLHSVGQAPALAMLPPAKHDQDLRFTLGLRHRYQEFLENGGMNTREAEERVDELVYVRLYEYWSEEEYLPFRPGYPKLDR